jgi:hypothetical protein
MNNILFLSGGFFFFSLISEQKQKNQLKLIRFIIFKGSNKQRKGTLIEQMVNIKPDKSKINYKKKNRKDIQVQIVGNIIIYHLKYLAALTKTSFSTNNSESNIAICAARPIRLLVPDGML